MNNYLSKSFYKEIFESWNNIGKIKSLIILIISIAPLILLKIGENMEILKFSETLILSIMTFLFGIIFLIIITKLWNLFGIKFEKPKWNENIITLDFSKSLNFLYFFGVLSICSGIIQFIYIGIIYQKTDFNSIISIVFGISLLSGIKLSLKLLKIS
ncbi:hypothetical protein [uncultured Polaribacter sp.]|uniref:hypothetical protein n=1 Tax=uncultured Polaribacter sp. TaxID=174711 RepID=UPI0026153491|nr:hypothetical protein [uncultured Polaribacter sp.]